MRMKSTTFRNDAQRGVRRGQAPGSTNRGVACTEGPASPADVLLGYQRLAGNAAVASAVAESARPPPVVQRVLGVRRAPDNPATPAVAITPDSIKAALASVSVVDK